MLKNLTSIPSCSLTVFRLECHTNVFDNRWRTECLKYPAQAWGLTSFDLCRYTNVSKGVPSSISPNVKHAEAVPQTFSTFHCSAATRDFCCLGARLQTFSSSYLIQESCLSKRVDPTIYQVSPYLIV